MKSSAARGVIAVSAVVAVSNVTVWLSGASPREVLTRLAVGTFGNAYGFGQTLSRATPLIWTGAAVAVALRARLFNIGAEGQTLVGILSAAAVGAWLPHATPAVIALPVCLLSAALGGGALGALAGWLRGRFGTHEVISTLMLNGLAAVITTWLYSGPLRVGAQVHTAPVIEGARLARAGDWLPALRGSGLNFSFVLAVGAALGAQAWLGHTQGGLRVRALGSSQKAAHTVGIDTARTTTVAMFLSGALAGLAGSHYVLGMKGYAQQGLGTGVGFVGIAVALMGGQTGLGIALAAWLFGALAQGGLVVNALVPADVLTITQAVTLVAVAAVGGAGLRRTTA